MKTILEQRSERLKECLQQPSEFLRELSVRFKPLLVKYGYWLSTRAFFPSTLVFAVNSTCNARCKMCDFGSKESESFSYNYIKDSGELPVRTYYKIIDSLGKRRPDIWFMATEPLLYTQLLDAINYSIQRDFNFQITTNGILLPEMAKELVETGIDRINVSIDGPSPAIHDKIRRVNGAFDAAWEGINRVIELRRCSKKYVQLVVTCCINQENVGYLEEFVRKMIELDIDYISLLHYQFVTREVADKQRATNPKYNVGPISTFELDPSKVNVNVLKKEIKQIKSHYRNYRVNFSPDMGETEIEKFYYRHTEFIKGFKRCYYPWRYMHILPSADVVAAYRCFSGKLGNLEKETVAQVWNGYPYREFRRDIKRAGGVLPACARCSVLFCSYYL